MGQTASHEDQNSYSKIKENFLQKSKIKDYNYGEGFLLEDKTTKSEIFLKEFILASEEAYNNAIAELEKRIKLKNPYILEIYGYTSKKETHFCSYIYKISVLIEFCNKSLESDIIERIKDNFRKYTTEELWYILESCILGFAFLQYYNYQHLDVRPATILLSKNGQFKVAEFNLISNKSSYGEMLKNEDHKIFYLSPSLMEALAQKNKSPIHNVYKSDAFSLAISLIHAASLSDCKQFYNYNEFKFDFLSLDYKIEELKSEYSHQFMNVLRKILVLDENQRFDFSQLKEFLQENQLIPKLENESKPSTFSFQKITFDNNPKNFPKDSETPLHQNEQFSFKHRDLASDLFLNQLSPDDISKQTKNRLELIKNLSKEGEHDKKTSLIQLKKIEIDSKGSKKDLDLDSFLGNGEDIDDILKSYGMEPLTKTNRFWKNTDYLISSNHFINLRNQKYGLASQASPSLLKNSISTQTKQSKKNLRNSSELDSERELKYTSKKFVDNESKWFNQANFDTIDYIPIHIKHRHDSEFQNNSNNPIFFKRYQIQENFPKPESSSFKRYQIQENFAKPESSKNFQLSERNFNKGEATKSALKKQEEIDYCEQKKADQHKSSRIINNFSSNHLRHEIMNEYQSFPCNGKLKESSNLLSPKDKLKNDSLFGFEIETNILQKDFLTKFKSYIKSNFDKLIMHDIIEENYSNGSFYIGQKNQGMKNGKGLFKYCNRSVYIGEWKENTMTGFGTLFNDQGKIIYRGEWINDKYHGRGVLHHPNSLNENKAYVDYNNFNTSSNNWIKYEGEFVLDKKEGYGLLYFNSGDIFEGGFKCDKIDGAGCFENKLGKKFLGVWAKNYLIS